MKPGPFAVEQWMDAYENDAKYNIAETCCASISISDLIEISDLKIEVARLLDASVKQTYGHIRGTPALRDTIASLYSAKGNHLLSDNVLITQGAIAANHLAFYALLNPGDHVVVQHPTYQQLYSIPESLGAKVSLWKAKPENGWLPDLDELEKLVTTDTKLIVLNNPNNPSGAVLTKSFLKKVVSLASLSGIHIMADEVYRPLFHGIGPADAELPPSILSLGYDKTIATSSLSKAYSLAGIRIGWIASRNLDIIEACAETRDYTTISVSQLDQAVAAYALNQSTIDNLLSRNIQLAKVNCQILADFVDGRKDVCEWVRPVAGTTAMVKFFHRGGKQAVDSTEFCKKLQETTGVMLLPADKGFGTEPGEFEGYVRFGYVSETKVLREGLDALSDEEADAIPSTGTTPSHRNALQPSERSPLLRELEPTPTNESFTSAAAGDSDAGRRDSSIEHDGEDAVGSSETNTVTGEDLERQTSLEGRLRQYEGIPEVKKRMKVMFPALAIGVFLAAADQTIIVSSYGRIGSDLGALNKTSRIATAYFLTLTSSQPLYGKLSDIFSRKACLLFAYAVFGLGCLFCGLARNIDELILARALAGIGGGGMTTVVSILLSDAIPLKERGTWQGFINIIYASGAGAGAPLGGLLADSIGWRWSFLSQPPLCLAAIIAVGCALKLPAREDQDEEKQWYDKLRRIDFLGAATLVAAVFCLIFGMDRGSNVSWSDRWAFVPLCLSFPLFGLFALIEMKVAAEPFAPGHIIFERGLIAAYLCNFFSFAGWLSALFYVPLYFQAVQRVSATKAGLLMIPSICCGVSGSLFGGYYMQRTGKYYWITVTAYAHLVLGLIIIVLCSGLVVSSIVGICIGMCVCGFSNGIGVTTSLIALSKIIILRVAPLLAMQLIKTVSNAAREDQAVATACSYLFRSLGSTTGVSLAATAANQTLRSSLKAGLGDGKQADKIMTGVRKSLDYIKTLDPTTRQLVQDSYALSTRAAFILEVGLALGSAGAAWLIRERPLSNKP
ncbi:hypothetical protein FH972_021494 [Carpinus fangiana]|uniref:Major facilitator superfamily (MFS) profile domain-containing protein n=1 Tax=Carpinus fangiana TaxID=176857 RepID=A0A5N6KPJ0_9ROSI|nr:hypothetical protein FH972_021494 [Carpinus fangiana]